jgi:hypothetical protein
MRRQPDPISISARKLAGALLAVLLSIAGWYVTQNESVHTLLFQKSSQSAKESDSRLDKLEAEVARLKERVRSNMAHK